VRLFRKAAKQGDRAGQYSLGFCFANGAGVVQDEEEAVKLYRQAADRDQGYGPSQTQLANCCMLGIGVARDVAGAARYVRLAADQGDAGAQHLLGYLREHGQGTKREMARPCACTVLPRRSATCGRWRGWACAWRRAGAWRRARRRRPQATPPRLSSVAPMACLHLARNT